jgi:hypothetical protein
VQDNDLGVKYMLFAISLKSKMSSEVLQSEGNAHACQPKAAAYPFVVVVTNSFSGHNLTSTHVPRLFQMPNQREITACSRYTLIPFDALALDNQTSICLTNQSLHMQSIIHSLLSAGRAPLIMNSSSFGGSSPYSTISLPPLEVHQATASAARSTSISPLLNDSQNRAWQCRCIDESLT